MAVIFCVAFVVITFCLIYLIRHGISLRSAPLIKPTVMDSTQQNVGELVALRLFPEFQSAHYVILGVLPTTAASVQLLEHLRVEFEKRFHSKVNWIQDGEKASPQDLSNCQAPCWVLVAKDKANELTSPNWVSEKIQPLHRPYFNLSWISFQREEQVKNVCEDEKRQTLTCLESVSVREVHKKFKEQNQRYFFMRKYNESDYFLFLESAEN